VTEVTHTPLALGLTAGIARIREERKQLMKLSTEALNPVARKPVADCWRRTCLHQAGSADSGVHTGPDHPFSGFEAADCGAAGTVPIGPLVLLCKARAGQGLGHKKYLWCFEAPELAGLQTFLKFRSQYSNL
jgi:hypothetical protein